MIQVKQMVLKSYLTLTVQAKKKMLEKKLAHWENTFIQLCAGNFLYTTVNVMHFRGVLRSLLKEWFSKNLCSKFLKI